MFRTKYKIYYHFVKKITYIFQEECNDTLFNEKPPAITNSH